MYSVKPALIKYKTPTIASCALTLETFFSILIYFIGLKIVNKFKLSQKQEGYLLEICINLWKDINLKSGTRYYAILLILRFSQRYPDIINEISYLLEDYYTNTLSPGIKCNVLKKAKRNQLK